MAQPKESFIQQLLQLVEKLRESPKTHMELFMVNDSGEIGAAVFDFSVVVDNASDDSYARIESYEEPDESSTVEGTIVAVMRDQA